MNLNGKKILFLSAHFFGYEEAIVNRLRELGAEVDFYNERPSESILAKGIIRVKRNLYLKRIKRYYQFILKDIKTKDYDFFLLIKGETVPLLFLEKFRINHPTTTMIYYSYDSAEEYPRFLKLYSYFDKNFTFEPKDAHQYRLHFRPLFFLNEYQLSASKVPLKYDLVFIGSAHTDRYLIGEKVRQLCKEKGLKSFFYYYAQSKIVFKLKKIFDHHLLIFDIKKLSFKKLQHSEIAEIYNNSRCVLDINKPFQEGLTMRTFEALAAGKKLVTTNADIRNYPFYNKENVCVLDREKVEIYPGFFKIDFKKLDNDTLKMMSLDAWIECLFLTDQDYYWKDGHPLFII
ncbi:lipopolysaccharide biosynthesis protein [Chryseobacterium sp. SNU WT5]|uniref:glycosyltransferase family protein n=1 Tax=Chryseobacterium sp. SNU WT5 TaxID=2594269 RepID=UPI00117E2B9F|nr:lipopolysaccharide biosynthesis protein [Chryseobacterium sp. SNU WT5]QDP86297.1 lipopolysaccharide biosynthesis protein [Chryseobacterium sp. SNU WT5]